MVNKVILIGNVGKDPETRHFDGGSQVTQFSLATTKKWKNKEGEKQEDTQWHNIVLWGGLSKIADKYVKKGDKLYLEGSIMNRTYEDKDGNKKYITEIVCKEMVMLGSKCGGNKGTPSGGDTSTGGGNTDSPATAEDDDLPF